MTVRGRPQDLPDVSIITCTKRFECMHNLFRNYDRQEYGGHKELILLLNNDNLDMAEYMHAARSYKNVSIHRLPERVTLGACLNYGVRQSRYGIIAKFDDDDYYAPGYLAEGIKALARTNADMTGKRAHYMYLSGKKRLLLRYPGMSDRMVPLVQGATLLVKRHVFHKVAFPDRNRGESVRFCRDVLAAGFRIYSGSPYNFVAIRRKDSRDHTWIVRDEDLLARNAKAQKVRDFRRFVRR